MVIVSPHLDDAVFSCGHFMSTHPGCIVITLFAGVPPADIPAPDWDAHCGFFSARQAVLARREEDAAALAALNAQPVWLPFLDSQYGQPPSPVALRDAVQAVLQTLTPGILRVPMGLFHSDHLLAHDAAVGAVSSEAAQGRYWTIHLYEDVPYRQDPERPRERLRMLRDQGWTLHRDAPAGDPTDKRKLLAAQRYTSQVRVMGAPLMEALAQPEYSWHVGESSSLPVPMTQRHGVQRGL